MHGREQGVFAQGGQQQDSHELLGKLIEGLLAEEGRAAKALQQAVSPAFGCFHDSTMPGTHRCPNPKARAWSRLTYASVFHKNACEQSLEPSAWNL